MTTAEQIRDIARRIRASWRLSRQTEPFHLEQDEAVRDLEELARRAEGAVTHETVSERRIG